MYLLRCTQPLLRDARRHLTEAGPADRSQTRLGDWYANRLNSAQQRYIIVVNTTTLLSVVVPARDLAKLPSRIADALAALLRTLGVEGAVCDEEIMRMQDVVVTAGSDASVRASANAIAQRAWQELYDVPHRPGRTLDHINVMLARTPLATFDYRTAAEEALARLGT